MDMEFEQLERLMSRRQDWQRYLGLSMVEIMLLDEIRQGARKTDIDVVDFLSKPVPSIKTASPRALVRHVRKEREGLRAAFKLANQRLAGRLAPLADRLGLGDLAFRALTLFQAIRHDDALEMLANSVKTKTRLQLATQLAAMLGGPHEEWRRLLATTGPLVESGMLDRDAFESASDLADYANYCLDLSEVLEGVTPVEECLLDAAIRPSRACRLAERDFHYLKEDLVVLKGLLRSSESAAQILLAGDPGVGKTELARVLARRSRRKLMEVRFETKSGKPAGRNERLQYFRLGQRLMPDRASSLLLFDEVEDVFEGEHLMFARRNGERGKAWINRLLEACQVPAIWITNDLRSIDPAYLRRFDHIVDMQAPPRSVRRAMLGKALEAHGVPTSLLDRAAESPELSPADIDRCARVLPALNLSGARKESVAAHLLSARPGSIPRSRLRPRNGAAGIPYDIRWIHCDTDVTGLIAGLRKRGQGTLGFFGPPGTGKTELARHIAKALDRPLLLKRASDLLGPYVGQTEQLIARAFEQALEDEAVLLIDEADSFLQARGGAHRSWEITQVNEMLAQLDGYAGIAILTSNFVQNLDPAVIRRIDVKLDFRYLKYEHAIEIGRQLVEGKASSTADAAFAKWRGVDLCFGDFAAARRGMALRGDARDPESLVSAVLKEFEARNGARKPIGFVA